MLFIPCHIGRIDHNGPSLLPISILPSLSLSTYTLSFHHYNFTIYGGIHAFVTTCLFSRQKFYTLYLELYYGYRNLGYAIPMNAKCTIFSQFLIIFANFKRQCLAYLWPYKFLIVSTRFLFIFWTFLVPGSLTPSLPHPPHPLSPLPKMSLCCRVISSFVIFAVLDYEFCRQLRSLYM